MPARTFPGLGLVGGRAEGENGWAAEMNTNLQLLSATVQIVIDSTEATEPGAPTDGDMHIDTGPWGGGTAGDIVIRDNGAWVAITPNTGWICYEATAGEHQIFNGTTWEQFQTAGLFLGTYVDLAALQAAHPTASEGNYAHVDAGNGTDVTLYVWDNDDSAYVEIGTTGSMTGAQIAAALDAELGTDWRMGTGAQIVAAIDAELGSTDWQTGGASPTVVARYWRLNNIYALAPLDDPSAVEIEFRDTVGGSKLVGTVAASTEFSGAYTAQMANDSDLGTLWASTAPNAWFSIDLGSGNDATVREVMLTARNDGNEEQTPTNWALEYSDDGLVWTQVSTNEDAVAWTGGEVRTYDVSADTAGEADALTRIEDATANRDLVISDFTGQALIKMTSASAKTVTVPPGITPTKPLLVTSTGGGTLTFVAGSGVTINSLDGKLVLAGDYAVASLIPDGTNNYILAGPLA